MLPNRLADPQEEIARQLSSAQRRLDALERIEGLEDTYAVATSALSMLPALRGLWPMSSVNDLGDPADISGFDNLLGLFGNPQYNLDGLAPYIEFDGVGDFLSAPIGSFTGTEAFINPAIRGLSLGGYFYFNNAPGAIEVMMSQHGAAGQRAFRLRRQATGELRFTISIDGTAEFDITSASVPGTAGWFYAACRFDPSVEQAVFFNAEKTTTLVGVPASIFASAEEFNISGRTMGTNLMTGRASLCYLCGADIGDTLIQTMFETTRGLFGL
jgi:hypothetical protein